MLARIEFPDPFSKAILSLKISLVDSSNLLVEDIQTHFINRYSGIRLKILWDSHEVYSSAFRTIEMFTNENSSKVLELFAKIRFGLI